MCNLNRGHPEQVGSNLHPNEQTPSRDLPHKCHHNFLNDEAWSLSAHTPTASLPAVRYTNREDCAVHFLLVATWLAIHIWVTEYWPLALVAVGSAVWPCSRQRTVNAAGLGSDVATRTTGVLRDVG